MILQSFKRLLGNGRAWLLNAPGIQETIQAFLKPVYDLWNNGYRIALTPFPTQNQYNNDLESDLSAFEDQFGINNPSTVKNERAGQIEAQWGMVGGQGYQYIEKVLKSAGLPVKVIENLPVQNFNIAGRIQYGNIGYGETIEGSIVQYGEMTSYKLIGNGVLNITGTNYDPVIINNCKYAFIIKCISPLTAAQYEILVNIILQIKPLQTVCLVKI